MTYTYDPALSTDVSLVRFHIGDNHDEGHYLNDGEIQYFVTNGSLGEAVVKCIRYIITQLSQPDFSQDWLSVSNAQARQGFENLLKLKQQEFGVSSAIASATISLPSRADSYQTDSDYDGAP